MPLDLFFYDSKLNIYKMVSTKAKMPILLYTLTNHPIHINHSRDCFEGLHLFLFLTFNSQNDINSCNLKYKEVRKRIRGDIL